MGDFEAPCSEFEASKEAVMGEAGTSTHNAEQLVEVEGTYSDESDGWTDLVTDDEGRLAFAGSRCTACGKAVLFRRAACPRCHRSDALMKIAIGGTARLIAFTISRSGLPGEPARALGLVEMPEGPTLVSELSACVEEWCRLDPGMELRLIAGTNGSREWPVIDGSWMYGFMSVPERDG